MAAREDLTTSNSLIQYSNVVFGRKNALAAVGKTFDPSTCHRIPGAYFFPEQKTPAAAGKTSTGLIHVVQSQELHFCRNKSACGSRADLTRLGFTHGSDQFCDWVISQEISVVIGHAITESQFSQLACYLR